MALLPIKDSNEKISIKFQYITLLIIVLCISIYFWQITLGSEQAKYIYSLGTIPTVLFGTRELSSSLVIIPEYLTVFTSLFLHGGWMHLLSNMLFLWVFGDNVEDSMGHSRFILFYIICGILATLTHAVAESNSNLPLIGASGAISGVLGAYVVLFPRAKILALFMNIIPIRLPALLVIGVWIAIQFLNINNDDGTAWWAHVGGFMSGVVLIFLFKRNDLILIKKQNAFIKPSYNMKNPNHSKSIFPDTSFTRTNSKDNSTQDE
tara:strand:- start:166 stop:957 length:792 start_codon:yes stop_codon:yes gene_type:complete